MVDYELVVLYSKWKDIFEEIKKNHVNFLFTFCTSQLVNSCWVCVDGPTYFEERKTKCCGALRNNSD